MNAAVSLILYHFNINRNYCKYITNCIKNAWKYMFEVHSDTELWTVKKCTLEPWVLLQTIDHFQLKAPRFL